jgi:hypothetical protein
MANSKRGRSAMRSAPAQRQALYRIHDGVEKGTDLKVNFGNPQNN